MNKVVCRQRSHERKDEVQYNDKRESAQPVLNKQITFAGESLSEKNKLGAQTRFTIYS